MLFSVPPVPSLPHDQTGRDKTCVVIFRTISLSSIRSLVLNFPSTATTAPFSQKLPKNSPNWQRESLDMKWATVLPVLPRLEAPALFQIPSIHHHLQRYRPSLSSASSLLVVFLPDGPLKSAPKRETKHNLTTMKYHHVRF